MHYISNTADDWKAILAAIGVRHFDELLAKIPPSLRKFEWSIPEGLSELELAAAIQETSCLNHSAADFACYLGGGVYDHYVPPVVNALAHRGEFITSYTPYQGEASQGTLQSIYEYQSTMCALTGMDYSNASMYDGASSLAEAALLAVRHTGRKKIIVASSVHPEYREVMKTYLSCIDVEIVQAPHEKGVVDAAALSKLCGKDTAAVIFQQPNFFGILEDADAFSEIAHQNGALLISSVNPVSLGILKPPGEYGADIAVGEGQPLGNALSFGGPHFGFFTVTEALLRKIPGRIAGMTVDKVGARAFVLTLQAREQHIRREKATSNICTNHSLCALKGLIYLSLLGKEGLKRLALLNFEKAHETYERLLSIKGVKPFSDKPFFNEFAVIIDKDARKLTENLKKNHILGPLKLADFYPDLKSAYLFAVTEKRTGADLNRLAAALKEA